MEWDPAYPMIVKLLSMDRGIPGQPNADSDYQIAPMHGDYSYRLFSNRGSARVLNVTVYHGTMSQMERPFFSSLSSQGIEIPGGEEVEIALSKEKRRGRWLPMPDGLCFLYIRQYYRDWDTEEPARLVIEREGAVYPPPKSDMSAVAERVKMMNDWMHTISNVAIRDASEILNGEPNTLKAHVFPTGANHEVDYYSAYSLCKPDEAVVIEFKPPNVRYWGVTLCGVDGGALQPHTRQVSINGHQAAVDADGKVRIVVSHVDPGVRNWLDTSGHDLALIACRILSPAATPTFGMKVVPLGLIVPADDGRRVDPAAGGAAERRWTRLPLLTATLAIDRSITPSSIKSCLPVRRRHGSDRGRTLRRRVSRRRRRRGLPGGCCTMRSGWTWVQAPRLAGGR
jgi:hypothetical protein